MNLVFYGWGEPVYILLMMLSICVNYFNGRMIDKYRADDKKARRFLVANTVVNLALLVFFKYYNLLAETISLIPGIALPELDITLPIGISFYTFQTMSYPIDVYRGDADVQKNFISFGTFVALFPQLIAGPIVRYKDVADQLGFRANSVEQFASGVQRFIVGLGKKVLIANNLGLLWDIYAAQTASQLTFAGSWIGALAFSLQIYFDFSGYSDMAIGLGRMLGFEFLENFNYPYISQSVTEFWHRWHISLSTWFRDYVYIPLGGNRVSKIRHIWNIFVVWFLTGVWHGANWTFICWGLLYFVLLMFEKLTGFHKKNGWYMHIYTMFFVILGWVLFRADSITAAGQYIGNMFGAGATGFIDATFIDCVKNSAVIFAAAVIFSFPVVSKVGEVLEKKPMFKNVLASVCMVVVFIASILICIKATYNPFIYLNF